MKEWTLGFWHFRSSLTEMVRGGGHPSTESILASAAAGVGDQAALRVERFTSSDPACRRVLARLLWTRRWMKHNGLPLVLEGAKVQQAARTDVRRTWKRHGWRPLSLVERRRRLRA